MQLTPIALVYKTGNLFILTAQCFGELPSPYEAEMPKKKSNPVACVFSCQGDWLLLLFLLYFIYYFFFFYILRIINCFLLYRQPSAAFSRSLD